VFENVIGQSVTGQLIQDIEERTLAPAMLFSGPPASGKGTAALELGRVISCEEGTGNWDCTCPSCSRHRLLLHPDLLCIGFRPFSAEIAASAGAFLRESAASPAHHSSRVLFIRSVRKLLARFNPVLWEDDPKAGKVSSLVNSLEEDLDELAATVSPEKLLDGMLKDAFKLESEGLGETIPVGQLRRSMAWAHLAPAGQRKLLVIENADRMQDEARNSLLKLLEEPPSRFCIVLTTPRPGSILPTLLSRLRQYRFNARDTAAEGEVIRRVFRDHAGSAGLTDYLESFLPVSRETLEGAAALFAASAAYKAVLLSKKQGRPAAPEVIVLGKYAAPKAEAAGLGRPRSSMASVIAVILEKTEGFEIPSLFSRFLGCLSELVSQSLRGAASEKAEKSSFFLPSVAYNDIWRASLNWAETAAGVYKIKPPQALEKLFCDLSRGMAQL